MDAMVSFVPRADLRANRKPALVTGDNGGLDVAVAVQHVAENLLQPREWRLAGNVVRGTNLLLSNQCKRLAHGLRGVMERGLERDFGIVQPVGIELHLGAAGASSEKVHSAAFANHVNRPFPRF